jgi:hypothetical protein
MEWDRVLLIAVPIVSSAVTGLIIWYGRDKKLEGTLEQRDKQIDDRLRIVEERIRASDSGVLAQRILHLELAVSELEDWRNRSVSQYIPALVDRIKDKLEGIEREIGTHETGLRGSAHRNSNMLTKLEFRIAELEIKIRQRRT